MNRRSFYLAIAQVCVFLGAIALLGIIAGCDSGKPPAAITATHAAPFGKDCAPISGASGACAIPFRYPHVPTGCETLHTEGVYVFECDPDEGWQAVGRYVDHAADGDHVHLACWEYLGDTTWDVCDNGGWVTGS